MQVKEALRLIHGFEPSLWAIVEKQACAGSSAPPTVSDGRSSTIRCGICFACGLWSIALRNPAARAVHEILSYAIRLMSLKRKQNFRCSPMFPDFAARSSREWTCGFGRPAGDRPKAPIPTESKNQKILFHDSF
jgi:hypothetical protein